MITAKIRIDSIKDSDGWFGLAKELGFSDEKVYDTFEYGEFADIEIEVDETLKIVGGRIIPFRK